MAANLVIAPEAAQDISDAYDWYENRRVGLGEDFLCAVDACFRAICRSPEMYPEVSLGCRRALVRRFPYLVFYESTVSKVTVYCVFHTAQDPKKWRERLP